MKGVRVALAVCVGWLAWPGGPARGGNPPEHALVESLRLAPEDASLLFAVDDASELRRGPVGGLALALIDGVAGFEQTFTAWDGFAENLGWTPAEAFDALLGRRVVLAARREGKGGAGAEGLGSWVLMSEVSDESARRLTERLKPMPRQLVAGAVVLSVEGGRFQIALSRRAAGAGEDGRGGGEGFLLLLAEVDGAGLLEQALREAQGGPVRSLADTPAAEQLRAIAGDARALLFADFSVFERLEAGQAVAGEGAEAAGVEDKGWIVGAARPTGDGLSMQAAIGSDAFEGAARRLAERASAGWDPGAFEVMAKDAVFASVESSASANELPWSGVFAGVARALGLDPELPARAALTGRLASLIVESGGGVLDGAVALETLDVRSLPEVADHAVARAVAHLRSLAPAAAGVGAAPGADAGAGRFDFGGVAPGATRSLDISDVIGPTLSAAWDDGAKLVWRFDARRCGPEGAANAALADGTAPPPAEQRAGWWTMGLGSSAVERLSRARLLAPAGPPGAARLDWVAMVSARPRALVERLEARGVPIVRPLEPARWVTRVTWFSALGPRAGVILAGGRVEISAPPTGVPANGLGAEQGRRPGPRGGTRATTPER